MRTQNALTELMQRYSHAERYQERRTGGKFAAIGGESVSIGPKFADSLNMLGVPRTRVGSFHPAPISTFRVQEFDVTKQPGPVIDSPESLSEKLLQIGAKLKMRDEELFVKTVNHLMDQAKSVGGSMLGENHPLAKVLGSRKGDPMLDVMMRNIEEYRRRSNEEEEEVTIE